MLTKFYFIYAIHIIIYSFFTHKSVTKIKEITVHDLRKVYHFDKDLIC